MKKIASFFLLIGFLFSCSTAEDPIGIDCEDFPESGSVLGYDFQEADFNYYKPCYNPYNHNQFIYCKRTTNVSSPFYTHEIRLFDFSTSEDRFICEGLVQFQMAWTNQDWIFFGTGFQIWKIKPDGSNLEMLTSNGENVGPIFNEFTNRVSFRHRVGNDQDQYFYGFYDPETMAFVDSIYVYPALKVYSVSYDWINADEIVTVHGTGPSDYGMYAINFQTFERTKLTTLDYDFSSGTAIITAVKVTPDGQDILWVNGTGLYRTNIASKECVKLKNSCESVAYINLSISSDGQTILAERREKELIAPNTIMETNRIVKMNIDGSNEQIIGLPE